MNSVVLVGRLARDPELRYLPQSNTANCTFVVAVDKGLSKDKKEEYTAKGLPVADFINVSVWGKTAEAVSKYVSKGMQICVSGRISTRSYKDKDGNSKTWTEVVASVVDFIDWKDKSNADSTTENQGSYLSDFEPREDENIPF